MFCLCVDMCAYVSALCKQLHLHHYDIIVLNIVQIIFDKYGLFPSKAFVENIFLNIVRLRGSIKLCKINVEGIKIK